MEQNMTKINSLTVRFIKDDIVNVRAEAVVTGEGPMLDRDSAVTKSLVVVMPQLEDIRRQIRKHGRRDLWTVHVSPLGSGSRFQYVIHAVLDKGNNDQWLRFMKTLYKNIFKEADRNKITSIALPVLGSGTSESDKTLSIQAVATSLLAYSCSPSYLTEIKVVTYDQDLLDSIQDQINYGHSKGSESSKGIFNKLLTGFKDKLLPTSYYDKNKAGPACSEEDCQVQRALQDSREEASATKMNQEDEHQLQRTYQQSDEFVINKNQKEAKRQSQETLEQYTENTTLTTGIKRENLSFEALKQSDGHTATGDTYQQDYLQDAKIVEGHLYLQLEEKRPHSPNEVTTLDKTSKSTSFKGIQLCIGEEDSHLKDFSTDDFSNLERSSDQVTDVNKANGKEHDAQANAISELDDLEKDLSASENSHFKHLTDEEIDTTSGDLKEYNVPENPLGSTEDNDKAGDSRTDSVRICPICLSSIKKPKVLKKCGHVFCQDCIDQSFQDFKSVCPSCNMVYGVITGNQPEGNMDVGFSSQSLPGYAHHGTITITYSFPSGIQKEGHPNPGKPYKGTTRRAYLPDCREGRDILVLLRTAFGRKLTFIIGQENVVIWNDIHHKTNMDGGPTRFGYPDSTYLIRVKDQLSSKGVTE